MQNTLLLATIWILQFPFNIEQQCAAKLIFGILFLSY